MSNGTATARETGYASINGLQMYYELHGNDGDGGTPLLLLHGGLFDIEQQFGALIPSLSAGRRVIATDFQGHGRTNDIDRPLGTSDLASDVVGLLEHLGVENVDVFGFSVGGAVRSRWNSRFTARNSCASSSFRRCRSGRRVSVAATSKRSRR